MTQPFQTPRDPLALRRGLDEDAGARALGSRPAGGGATTYQGMLFLTDAARGEGSFECVPSIFQDLDRYLHEHPGRVLDAPVDVAGHDVVEVPARAGDLVVWNARLPHQGGRNGGGRPQISLDVSMRQRAQTPTVRNASNAGSGNALQCGGVAGRDRSTRSRVNQPSSLRSVADSSELIVGHSR